MFYFQLGYDCHYPYNTPFAQAIGPLASTPGAPPIVSLRTIKSDIVVGIPDGVGEKLDEEEKGWKISGKVRFASLATHDTMQTVELTRAFVFLRLQYAVVLYSEGRPGEKITFSDAPEGQ